VDECKPLADGGGPARRQGLTLAHLSAQPQPFLSLKTYPEHPLIPPRTPYTPPKQPLNVPPIPQKALTLRRKVDECKPLHGGSVYACQYQNNGVLRFHGRGLHSSTFRLNLSRFLHKIHPTHTNNPPRHPTPKQPLKAAPILQKALALSRKVDECKPLFHGDTLQYQRIAATHNCLARPL